MFPTRFVSLVVVALSTLTVHGLPSDTAPAVATHDTNGTSGMIAGAAMVGFDPSSIREGGV